MLELLQTRRICFYLKARCSSRSSNTAANVQHLHASGKSDSFCLLLCEPQPASVQMLQRRQNLRCQSVNVVTRILQSRIFYSEAAVGRKIRSPIEFSVGMLRALEGTTNVTQLSEELKAHISRRRHA